MRPLEPAPGKRVLIALDGSPAAFTALPFARAIAERLHARTELVHCTAKSHADADLWRRLEQELSGTESIRVRPQANEAATGILQAASEPDVLLVVLTTHGRAVEGGKPLGRVAEAVIAGTSRPIVLIRPEAAVSPAGARTLALRRLLIPLDGTPGTSELLQPAADLAAQLAMVVDVLYVAPPEAPVPTEPGTMGAPRYVDQPQHEWPAWKREVVDRLCACLKRPARRPRLRTFLAHGDIARAIVRFAEEHRTDLITLVRRSHLEPGRAAVLRTVLAEAPCPILLLGGPQSQN
ncbi:MAG TPA: universal stress protein [Chloroflexota bacterium]|nr:universal stress protein [Chloroflexota bacterium]